MKNPGRASNSQSLDVSRVVLPFSQEFETFWRSYSDSFPIRSEREPKERVRELARMGTTHAEHHRVAGTYEVEHYHADHSLFSFSRDSKFIGGAVYNYSEKRGNIRDIAIASGLYHFVEVAQRNSGVGTRMHEWLMEYLGDHAHDRGMPLDLTLIEVNDPKLMSPKEFAVDSKTMDPNVRLEFWNGRGYRAVDPNKFTYLLPGLEGGVDPWPGLLLCLNSKDARLGNSVQVDYLKQVLQLHIWAGFKGIPGSDIDGLRDPFTDDAYRVMSSRLDTLQNVKKEFSIPLVELSTRRREVGEQRQLI